MRLVWLWVFAAILITGCQQTGDGTSGEGSSPGSSPETTAENPSGMAFGERVEVGNTEVLVWGQGDYGVVMAHGAAYDATSWEEQGQRIGEEGMVALAVEDTFPESLLASIDYLKAERGAQGVALVGASAGGSAALQNEALILPGGAHAQAIFRTAEEGDRLMQAILRRLEEYGQGSV